MLNLPILNVRLQACPEDWQQMTPTDAGRHCATCARVVIDFTNATQADLQAARAAAPDGRVCGRFHAGQLAPPPKLRPRLRRFVVALVLVCGLGLSAREAVAQVKPVLRDNTQGSTLDEMLLAPLVQPHSEPAKFFMGVYVEQMPVFPGGQESLLNFLRQHNQFPNGLEEVKGRVFVSFTVSGEGRVVRPVITKGLHPTLDAEALRLVQLLDTARWQPGRQNGRPVGVSFTVPIIFDSTLYPPTKPAKKTKRAQR